MCSLKIVAFHAYATMYGDSSTDLDLPWAVEHDLHDPVGKPSQGIISIHVSSSPGEVAFIYWARQDVHVGDGEACVGVHNPARDGGAAPERKGYPFNRLFTSYEDEASLVPIWLMIVKAPDIVLVIRLRLDNICPWRDTD